MRAKILVVEDEQDLSEVYEFMLKGAGYNVRIAADGDEALKICETFVPDLILLDLRMPKVTGLEFLQKYDLIKHHPKVKVIVFSNLDTQSDIDKAYELGAVRYMLKAWASPKELLVLVEQTLNGS